MCHNGFIFEKAHTMNVQSKAPIVRILNVVCKVGYLRAQCTSLEAPPVIMRLHAIIGHTTWDYI